MKFKKWYFVVLLAALIVVVSIFANREETPLPGYVESSQAPTEEASEPSVDLSYYTDEATGLSIGVPTDWQKITKDGFATFIHAPSASSVQIKVLAYDPALTGGAEATITQFVEDKNGTLTSFTWLKNDQYTYSYQISHGRSVTDYFDVVQFDMEHVICVEYIVNDDYLSKFESTLFSSIDSIVWEPLDPVPANVVLQYSDIFDFEFGVPGGESWQSSTSNGTVFLQDQSTGATVSVSAGASDASYKDVSQIAYINWVSSGRSNLNLNQYANDGRYIYAISTYQGNNGTIVMEQVLCANGSAEYALTMECPYENYQSVSELFSGLRRCFRVHTWNVTEESFMIPSEAESIAEEVSLVQQESVSPVPETESSVVRGQ